MYNPPPRVRTYGSDERVTAENWQEWHAGAVRALDTLLSARSASGLRTVQAASPAPPTESLAKARALIKVIAATVAHGDAAAWNRLGLAFDVIDVAGLITDGEPGGSGSVDSTMPTAAAYAQQSDSAPESVDETIALHDVRSPVPRGAQSEPVGSTLMEGEAPRTKASMPTGDRNTVDRGTVAIPIVMPGGITAQEASARRGSDASSKSVDTPEALDREPLTQEPLTQEPLTQEPHAQEPRDRTEDLDLERYAVLCAWIQLQPNRRTHLHSQYGLNSEAQRQRLDDRFQDLFAKNPELRRAFDERLALHLRFLQR